MIWTSVQLALSANQIKKLKARNAKVIKHLEEGFPLRFDVLESLQSAMTDGLNSTPEFVDILQKIADSGDHYTVNLLHDDNEILNLPWGLAEDRNSGETLGKINQLTISKCLPAYFKTDATASGVEAAPPPLKILIMISSPEDASWKQRLSYEEEEFHILRAFEPLMRLGQVEIDFTDDGSLESLEAKIKANQYHILHFSGHGVFKDEIL